MNRHAVQRETRQKMTDLACAASRIGAWPVLLQDVSFGGMSVKSESFGVKQRCVNSTVFPQSRVSGKAESFCAWRPPRHCSLVRKTRHMGKLSSGVIEDVRIKVPRRSGQQPCGAEMITFLSCLDSNGQDERLCMDARHSLQTCMGATRAVKHRHKAPILPTLEPSSPEPSRPPLLSGDDRSCPHAGRQRR